MWATASSTVLLQVRKPYQLWIQNFWDSGSPNLFHGHFPKNWDVSVSVNFGRVGTSHINKLYTISKCIEVGGVSRLSLAKLLIYVFTLQRLIQDFHRGHQPERGRAPTYCLAKSCCMKMKKMAPGGPKFYYVDPPLLSKFRPSKFRSALYSIY